MVRRYVTRYIYPANSRFGVATIADSTVVCCKKVDLPSNKDKNGSIGFIGLGWICYVNFREHILLLYLDTYHNHYHYQGSLCSE